MPHVEVKSREVRDLLRDRDKRARGSGNTVECDLRPAMMVR